MTIRWRLVAFALQIGIVVLVSYQTDGKPVSSATWYASLIALTINTQLLEPFFAKPVDVIGNSIVGLLLYALAPRTVAAQGWQILAAALVAGLVLAAIALLLGANRKEGRFVRLGRATRLLSAPFTSRFIYSAIFWLGAFDHFGGISAGLWKCSVAWLLVIGIGQVNWQAVWATAGGGAMPVVAEGLIGPTRLLVAGPELPKRGSLVTVSSGSHSSSGTVLTRIRRASDVWAAIHVNDSSVIEHFVRAPAITVAEDSSAESDVLGSVDANSTNSVLVFSPTKSLRVGDVVAVLAGGEPVLYQLTRAEVVDVSVKGGGHLTVQARASQLGVLRSGPTRLVRHRWVPEPGAAVVRPPVVPVTPGDTRFLLGHLIGTTIPVYLDPAALCEGHLAVLGMTRMGKTTLAVRLAKRLMQERAVVVLDQTGEYRSKQGLPPYDASIHDSSAGLSVFEPAAGAPTPDEGLKQLKHFANKGYTEYKTASPFRRVLVVDEAHQFVPEPALLGFNAPGRESAISFGMYAMQVRKYGITLALISQRTAVVAKTALSQCENLIAFKSVDQTGLDYLEAVLGPQAREILPNLQQGEALVSGPAVSSDYPLAITVATD